MLGRLGWVTENNNQVTYTGVERGGATIRIGRCVCYNATPNSFYYFTTREARLGSDSLASPGPRLGGISIFVAIENLGQLPIYA